MSQDALFALRPTSVQRHFGRRSKTLLIGGGQLTDAAVIAGVDTLAVEVERAEVIPGVMRAAEDLDAALTVTIGAFWVEEGGRQNALATAAAVVDEADRVRLEAPLVLATVADGAVHGWPVEAACERLLSVIDAGFTCFQFPMPGDRDELACTLAMMRMVAEFDLGIELIDVPSGGAERALELLRRLGLSGCGISEGGAGMTLLVVDNTLVPREHAVRLQLPGDRFLRIIARSLDVELDEALFTPIDAYSRDRIEAVTYTEVRHVVRKAGLIGSGSSCLAALSWAE